MPDFGPRMDALPPWGPTALQRAACRADAHVAARGEDRHYGEEGGLSDDEEEVDEEEDGEYNEFGTLDAVTAVERADVYRSDD